MCAIVGSKPPSVPDDFCARMITDLKDLGVETVLDTDGESLHLGLKAGPAAVTPNRAEAEEAVGHEFNDREELLAGVRGLVELGANEAVITSESGCVAIAGTDENRRAYEVTAPELDAVSAVGSGDAFLAGYVAARWEGQSQRDCLAYGVACGAESTQHFGAGSIDREEVEHVLESVEVADLEARAAVS
jgi:fructose-1-phosphate kinase PfkB-like protein